jgi:hypothetical protein
MVKQLKGLQVRLLELDSRTSGEGESRNIRDRKETHIGIHLRRIF